MYIKRYRNDNGNVEIWRKRELNRLVENKEMREN